MNLAFELVLTGVKFAQDASLGMRTAAADAGNASVSINGPTSINPVLAQTQVTSVLGQSPDGIAIDPGPSADLWTHTLSSVVHQVKDALAMNGKPVNTPGQIASAILKTFVGISDTSFARDLATATIKSAGLSPTTTGTVLVGQCVPGTTGQLSERNAAYVAVIRKLLPKTTIVQFDSQVVPGANTAAWMTQLSAHPNPVLAIGGCDQDGASLYLLKKKTGQHFAAAGIDLTPQTLQGVADGTLTDAMTTDYYVQGYVVAALLAKAVRGTPLPSGFVDTGYTLITKKNVAAITSASASSSATIAYWKPKVQAILSNVPAVTKPLAAAWR